MHWLKGIRVRSRRGVTSRSNIAAETFGRNDTPGSEDREVRF